MHRDDQAKPFNEQAALAELERLRAAIQATRRKREQAVAEFDAFLRATRSGLATGAGTARARVEEPAPQEAPASPSGPATAATVAAAGGMAPAVPDTAAIPATTSAPSEKVADAPASTPAPIDRTVAFPAPDEEEEPSRSRAAMRWLAAAAVMVIATLAIAWWVGRSPSSPEAPAAVPAAEETAAPAAAPSEAPAPPPVDPWAGLPEGVRVELVTDRTVWLRVFVDDRRMIEREVPGGERLRFAGNRYVVVRAGDAGGVRAIVGGVDQGVMGRDGIPVTRVFRPSDKSEGGSQKQGANPR
ncbi:MAG TPA: RodZ domain-containing protein [Vicinamibacterales bacterium]